jgi:hypothetical protein
MPISTQVKCVNCGKLVEASEVTIIAGVITHCPHCEPAVHEAFGFKSKAPTDMPPESKPETGRPEVTADIPATDAERRAVVQDAPVLVDSAPSDGKQVKVPAAFDPEDPERTCGPVEIVEEDGEQMFNQVLPAPEVDQLRERLREARMRLVILKETIQTILPMGPEIKILSRMVNHAIENL